MSAGSTFKFDYINFLEIEDKNLLKMEKPVSERAAVNAASPSVALKYWSSSINTMPIDRSPPVTKKLATPAAETYNAKEVKLESLPFGSVRKVLHFLDDYRLRMYASLWI